MYIVGVMVFEDDGADVGARRAGLDVRDELPFGVELRALVEARSEALRGVRVDSSSRAEVMAVLVGLELDEVARYVSTYGREDGASADRASTSVKRFPCSYDVDVFMPWKSSSEKLDSYASNDPTQITRLGSSPSDFDSKGIK